MAEVNTSVAFNAVVSVDRPHNQAVITELIMLHFQAPEILALHLAHNMRNQMRFIA
jgi:predicted nucleic acid-binding protein